MPNKGFYKNETFFTQKFKNLTICLDLNKNNENTLFALPIYTSNTSKLLSLSLVYNKLDSSPSFCNDLSHNYHSYISNVTSQSLSLRFFDGNTYVFRASNGKFVNDELDAEISNVGIIFYELKMPGYKSIKYITNGSVFILFQIESYDETLTFGYDSDGKITTIQSDAFNSESITFTYEQNHTYIDIYRNNEIIYSSGINYSNNILQSISFNKIQNIWNYSFTFTNQQISITDVNSGQVVSLMKYLLTGYEYTDEYGLSTSIVISDNESTVTTPYGEVTTYKFYNGLIYEILKDNAINYYAFDNNKLIVNSHIYNEPNKIGGRLTSYVIYQNDSTLINDETLDTYPLPIYQNERGIVFEFDETEKLTKRFDYKGRKGEPVSTVIHYQLYDFDDFFGHVNFTINFYTSSGRKLLTTSPTISYGDSITDVWRLAVLSAVTDVDYDYFEVEVIARGFYSRIYLYIDAYVCCLADTYKYQNNKLISSLSNGVPQYIFYNDKGIPVGDGSSVASYNNKSQLIYQSDLFGNVTKYNYDNHNRLLSGIFTGDGYQNIKAKVYLEFDNNIEYESNGERFNIRQINNYRELIQENITSADPFDPITFKTNTYSYNRKGQLIYQNINNHQSIDYSYNFNKDILTLNDFSYSYTADYLLNLVSYANSPLVSYTYDSLNRVATKQYLNGTYSFSYDNKNRISTIQYNNEDFIQYTYDDYFGRVTSINEDAFIYDEFSNIKTISNNEYTKRNIIDYRTNQLFQNIEIANSNIVVNEISNNTSNDYADLVNELIAASEYSTFFRRRKLETVDSNPIDCSSMLTNPYGNYIFNPNDIDFFEYVNEGVISYVRLSEEISYSLPFNNNLQVYQAVFLFKKINHQGFIEFKNEYANFIIQFTNTTTCIRVTSTGESSSINTSFIDNKYHLVVVNIYYNGLIEVIVDGDNSLSLSYSRNITTLRTLCVSANHELFGLLLNTDNYCFDSQTIIDIYNNYRKIIQKQSDNLIDSVYYPTITMSSTLSLPDYEYYSFNKTYNSSSGKKPLSITYSLVNRDEDSDFVFDISLKRYVYSTLDKTLKYIVSRYSNGTVSFFVKPLDVNQIFIKLGTLEIGINNQRKLYLKSGTTTRTSTSTFSRNKYYSIVVTYSFVTSTKCNLAIYLDGVSSIVLLNATTSSLVAVTIPSGKSYIKDLCFVNNVIPLSQISSFINKFKNNARHVSFCNSLNLIQKEQILNDSSVIVDSTYTYQRDEQNNKKERISMIRKETSELTFIETYSYDVLGRVVSMNDQLRNSFTYDENFQLSNASIGIHNYSYTYDSRGNILSKTKDNQMISFSYDNYYPDRLSQAGSKSFTYFANNPLFISQITDNETTITLSYQGKNLKTYEIENDKQISFEYNYNNLRTKKIIVQGDNVTTYSYYYDLNNNLVKQVKTDNNSTQEITFLRDSSGLYGFIYNDSQYFYIKNLLGIIYKIIDINGDEVVNYEYDPYGKLISVTGSLSTSLGNINPYIYKEYYYDVETSLYYVTSRYYDPEIGRFISPDSVDYLDPTTINGLNLYAYCNNDPVNYCDPSGHLPQWANWLIGGTLVVGAIALTIVTAGLGGAIAGAIGTGIWASIAGGAIAGGIVGAASGALLSAGTQIISNGVDDFSWNEVGKGALTGLITGTIAGGIFGGITHVYSSEILANATSGLDAAKYELNNSFGTLKSIKSLTKMPFASSNIAKAVANAAINYNKAYANYIVAKTTYGILKYGFSVAYFVGENYLSDWLGIYI